MSACVAIRPCAGKPRDAAALTPRRAVPRLARVPLEAELAAELRRCAGARTPIDFATWASRVFRHQFERNLPYHAYCLRRGITPETVARWEDVPAVPAPAFRSADLVCGPPEAVFRTSGTSGG